MSSMRFNSRLDTSHHGPPHPLKDAWAVTDSLAVIRSIRWWSASSLSRGALYTRAFMCPHRYIFREVWRAWRPCSGFSSTYPSVMINVTENISHSTANFSEQYYFSYNSQMNVSGHMLIYIYIFSYVGLWNSCPNSVRVFQSYPAYIFIVIRSFIERTL
jgi:hypothetical protein